ncbi:MAG: glycoside hydrolase, partial [Candidatus Bathyarchaeota archaeon]|nr:glycoside hydrolase [Candidatus Bathyarchaeota archaeon]
MRLKHQILAGLIIILLALAMILPVSAFEDTQTRHIEAQDPGLDADWFVTEAGLGYSTSLVTITDPNMDIFAYLFFEDIKINYWQHLENATLWLRTASSMSFDAESKVTIYGVDDYRYFGSGTKGYGPLASPGSIMGAPLTIAHVIYNTSQFYGPQWWNISVTNIVQELKSNYHWDGPGFVRSDPGDNMGFIIQSAGGYDTRYFYDLKAGNGLEAKLELHWGGSSHPPSGYPDAVFNETYGNHSIWKIVGDKGYPLEPIEYVWGEGSGVPYEVYYDDVSGAGPYLVNTTGIIQPTSSSNQRAIVRTNNGTIYAVYETKPGASADVFIKRSHDEGMTWVNETLLSKGATQATGNEFAGIAVDSADGLHIVYVGGAGDDQIFYTYCPSDGDFTTPLDISTAPCTGIQQTPSIALDSNNTIHVVWSGRSTAYPVKQQIYYSNFTGTWSTPLAISPGGGRENEYQKSPAIAIDSQDILHIVWTGQSTAYPTKDQLWHRTRVNGVWGSTDRVCLYGTQGGYYQSHASLAVDSNDGLHAVFSSKATGLTTHDQIWENNYTGVWDVPIRLSTYAGMNTQIQGHPTIAIDENDILYSVWQGNADGHAPPTDIWLANNTGGSWNTPVLAQGIGQNEFPNLRWSRWPVDSPDSFLVADINGTVLADGFETLEDAQDWIDLFDTDPEDPDPGGEWGTTGPFTRFKMRLYFLILGFGCVFGPVLFFSWRRPTAYYL